MDLYLLIFAIAFICLPFVRFMTFHWYKVLYSTVMSTYDYVKYKRWRECRWFGKIICFCGLFGMGKTKEAVRFVAEKLYKMYEGKLIYDDESGEWVTQHIHIYSNVELKIPYFKFHSMQQLVDCQRLAPGIVSEFLIDEGNVIFSSREYKDNFSTPALNAILTCRHNKIGLVLTAQRFSRLDALLRDVIVEVIECKYNPFTHIQKLTHYDAYDLENCSNASLVSPLRVEYAWTSKRVYDLYDTYAIVEDITKICNERQFITDLEYLQSQMIMPDNMQMVNKLSHKGKKRFKT